MPTVGNKAIAETMHGLDHVRFPGQSERATQDVHVAAQGVAARLFGIPHRRLELGTAEHLLRMLHQKFQQAQALGRQFDRVAFALDPKSALTNRMLAPWVRRIALPCHRECEGAPRGDGIDRSHGGIPQPDPGRDVVLGHVHRHVVLPVAIEVSTGLISVSPTLIAS